VSLPGYGLEIVDIVPLDVLPEARREERKPRESSRLESRPPTATKARRKVSGRAG